MPLILAHLDRPPCNHSSPCPAYGCRSLQRYKPPASRHYDPAPLPAAPPPASHESAAEAQPFPRPNARAVDTAAALAPTTAEDVFELPTEPQGSAPHLNHQHAVGEDTGRRKGNVHGDDLAAHQQSTVEPLVSSPSRRDSINPEDGVL